ncbi:MAG: hypothetical protein AB8F95_12055 [Bacteroidia bacterium]
MLSSLYLSAQQADFTSPAFSITDGKKWYGGEKDGSANLQAFSDGRDLHVFVEVKDDILISDSRTDAADHIEITFSLAQAYYPESFSNHLHPYYFVAKNQQTRGNAPDRTHRFFSVSSEELPALDVTLLENTIPYPSIKEIKDDTLSVPTAKMLKTSRVDFGLVTYAFFPDGRPARLLNRHHFASMEDNLNVQIGEIEAGLLYTTERRNDGYVFNIQVSPQALGFIAIPVLSAVDIAADFFDYDVKKGLASILSFPSSSLVQEGKPRNFTRIDFQKPINTNLTQAPDRMLLASDFSPVLAFTTEGWAPLMVDADMLCLRAYTNSSAIQEVHFGQSPFQYDIRKEKGTNLIVEQLVVNRQFVNDLPKVLEYVLLDDVLISSERFQNRVQVLDTSYHGHAFSYQDGGIGFIQVENSSLHPRGWGECGTCIQEKISVLRFTPSGPKAILQLRQGEENSGTYLEIQDISLPGFVVDRLDWVSPGRILVLQLQNRLTGERKRIRSSWAVDGTNVRSELLP